MISRKTVLVLGAGASAPFGFPTGETLLRQICADLEQSSSSLRDMLLYLRHSEEDLRDFRRALDGSMQPSVDAFLERRAEFMELGKAAIAATLIPYERESYLQRQDQPSWYEYLWQKMTTPNAAHFEGNELTVVTFNYDRSWEHFLYLRLTHSYKNLRDQDISELFRRVPVIHLYGRLGDLPFLGPNVRAYDPDVRPESLERWANSIRIFTEEGPPDDPNFATAWRALNQAEVVWFLGFAYHEENVRRLKVSELLEGKEVYGSAFRIAQGDRPAIQGMFPGGNITLGSENTDALGLLRNYPLL